ncbi:subtilisin-like serine protease, partial [Quaeritorhiza haematococci]
AIGDRARSSLPLGFISPNTVVTALGEQRDAPWGLVRTSTRNNDRGTTYNYPDKAGEGVDAYVVDTGIQVEHPEFESRARFGFNAFNDSSKDVHGHGTHVAGTIGSRTFGIAKKVSLVAVKVLADNGTGTTSSVLAGLEYVVNEAKTTKRPSVINMSLGGPADPIIDLAVSAAVRAGVYIVAAGGNERQDACNVSPARAPSVLTVGATDINDFHGDFSNFGSCLDINAPGVDIRSTWPDNGFATASGTSMASPHVAGVMALILAERQFEKVEDGFAFLLGIGTRNRLQKLRKSANLLVYNGVVPGEDKDAPANPPKFTCGWLRCWWAPDCEACSWAPW